MQPGRSLSSWFVYLVGQYVEYSVQDSESFHISQRHRLNLKLLLQSVKVKANVSGSCPDTHLNSNIHSIYFSLNSWGRLGAGLLMDSGLAIII